MALLGWMTALSEKFGLSLKISSDAAINLLCFILS